MPPTLESIALVIDRIDILDIARRSQLEPHSILGSDFNFDSLDRIELIVDLEHNFGIVIDDDTAATWLTIADIARSVDAARNGRCAA